MSSTSSAEGGTETKHFSRGTDCTGQGLRRGQITVPGAVGYGGRCGCRRGGREGREVEVFRLYHAGQEESQNVFTNT